METHTNIPQNHTPWNRCKLVGQKSRLKLKEIWAICIRLQLPTEPAISPYSTLQSTVSNAAVI